MSSVYRLYAMSDTRPVQRLFTPGDHVAHFKLQAGSEDKKAPLGRWQKMSLVHLEDDANKRKAGLREAAGELYSTHDFFEILEQYEKQDACMAAYSKGTSDKNQASGIVQGHAYAVMNVAEASDSHGKHQLIQLRNPCVRRALDLSQPCVCRPDRSRLAFAFAWPLVFVFVFSRWGNDKEWSGDWSDHDSVSWTRRMRNILEYVPTIPARLFLSLSRLVSSPGLPAGTPRTRRTAPFG